MPASTDAKLSSRRPRPGTSANEPPAKMPMKSPTLSRRAQWAGGEPIANRLMAQTIANPDLVSLAAGFVDHESLPVGPAREAIEQLLGDPQVARTALQYGTTIGYLPLRETILQRLLEAEGKSAAEIGAAVDQVVVTAGSNQLLYLVADAILDPGDVVLCGSPSYFVILGTWANLGARAVGVPIDDQGPTPDGLDEVLRRFEREGELPRVKALYVASYYDNPTGITVPLARRRALLDVVDRWAEKQHLYVLEDLAYRDLRYYGDDIPSMRSLDARGNTVVAAGTFSKSFSPGLRVGWGLLPQPLVGPVLSGKGNIDFGSPNFNQVLLHRVLSSGLFDDHLETIRAGYRRKIDTTLAAAEEFLGPIGGIHWVRPTGGLYVWLTLPESVDTGLHGPLFGRAVDEGVLYVPGEYCYPPGGGPVPKNRLRLSFGVPSCENIRRGIEALARAIRAIV